MPIAPLRHIVIVGGGTAGWMCAAALSKLLPSDYRIRLVESDEIGIIGVGEATIPFIRSFNERLEIDESEFMWATQGSFKLGIEFVNWAAIGDHYIHGFGRVGVDVEGTPFHHIWRRLHQLGLAADLGEYSLNTVAPALARFQRPRPDMTGSPLADLAYAYHFGAGLYARFLRTYAEARGAQRSEGRIEQVLQDECNGHVRALRMASGELIEGDFFIDCSGMRALLIEQTLQSGFEDWSHWLPCDRAQAVPCASADPLLPITRSTAHGAGWQWRIPLQHRIGNGHVYASAYLDDDQAQRVLLDHLDGPALAEPRLVKFRTGRRKQSWCGNCVAVGLSSGFLEPLESTSIHLIHTAINRLLVFFPHAGLEAIDIAEYNRQTQFEYERVRDFIILHYKATEREDTPFWQYCRHMEVPDTLQQKMDLFRSNGRILREGAELFVESSWLQVMVGQRILPQAYHPFAERHPLGQTQVFVQDVQRVIRRCAESMPEHAQFIARYCASPKP